jgi:hypothetical protein
MLLSEIAALPHGTKGKYVAYAAAESVNHFEESISIIYLGAMQGTFDEHLIRLFAYFTRSSKGGCRQIIDSSMIVCFVDICLERFKSPFETTELVSILELFSALFITPKSGIDLESKHYDVCCTLFNVSYSLNSELNEKIARFLYNDAQENPRFIYKLVNSGQHSDHLQWMPKTVSLNEFTSRYLSLFK